MEMNFNINFQLNINSLQVNQSLEAPEEDEEQVNQEVPECEPEPKEDPSVTSREIIKYMPDYYESSDDEDSKRKVVSVAPRLICSCSGDGSCLFCKKMRGCTCDCLLYTSPSPRDATLSRMPSSA